MTSEQAAQAIFDMAASGSFDTERMRKIIERVKQPYPIPGPYEIALQLGCALAASGKYPTPDAAIDAAWMTVPSYFAGRDRYVSEMVPAMAAMKGHASIDGIKPDWVSPRERGDDMTDDQAAAKINDDFLNSGVRCGNCGKTTLFGAPLCAMCGG